MSHDPFAVVRHIGLTMEGVEAATSHDGSPRLKYRGVFMAGLATHPSAEPNSLVVRAEFEDRARLLEDAPETYYVTDYYEKHPVVLARLDQMTDAALRDLLSVSRRLSLAKARR
jgi:hypothetical protein